MIVYNRIANNIKKENHKKAVSIETAFSIAPCGTPLNIESYNKLLFVL